MMEVPVMWRVPRRQLQSVEVVPAWIARLGLTNRSPSLADSAVTKNLSPGTTTRTSST
jgi:hypothetical protein